MLVTDLTNTRDQGPVSDTRLWLDKDGQITTVEAEGVELVAAPGAFIDPEYWAKVRAWGAAEEERAAKSAGKGK